MLKIGDWVMVIPYEKIDEKTIDRLHLDYNEDMQEFSGTVTKIKSRVNHRYHENVFRVEDSPWTWKAEWLIKVDGVSNEPKPEPERETAFMDMCEIGAVFNSWFLDEYID